MKRILYTAVTLPDGRRIAPAVVTRNDRGEIIAVEPFTVETHSTVTANTVLVIKEWPQSNNRGPQSVI